MYTLCDCLFSCLVLMTREDWGVGKGTRWLVTVGRSGMGVRGRRRETRNTEILVSGNSLVPRPTFLSPMDNKNRVWLGCGNNLVRLVTTTLTTLIAEDIDPHVKYNRIALYFRGE